MSAKRIRSFCFLFTVVAIFSSCKKKKDSGVNFGQIDDSNKKSILGWGEAAQGMVGDYYIDNGIIRVIVQKPNRDIGPCPYGGTPVDMFYIDNSSISGFDEFGEVIPLIDAALTVDFETVEFNEGEDDQGPYGEIVATGYDTIWDFVNIATVLPGMSDLIHYDTNADLPIKVTAHYRLRKNREYLDVIYTIQNLSDSNLDMSVGIVADTGGSMEVFSPTRGFKQMSVNDLMAGLDAVEWFAHLGRGIGYSFVPFNFKENNSLTTPISEAAITVAGVSVAVIGYKKTLDALTNKSDFVLPANGQKEYGFRIYAGKKDIASLYSKILNDRDIDGVRVEGSVVDPDGNPVSGTRIALVTSENVVKTVFESDSDGKFSGLVDPGTYTMICDHLERGQQQKELEVKKGMSSVKCELPSSGRVMLSVTQKDGTPTPCNITVYGADDRNRDTRLRDVAKGKGHFPEGVVTVVHMLECDSGVSGAINLAAGRYRVVVSRGPEFTIVDKVVDLNEGDSLTISGTLERVVDTSGYIASDLHVHSINSPDSPTTLEQRIASFVANGMEVIVSTDHDYVTDYAPVIKELNVSPYITSVIGEEITTWDYGHFNAYPLIIDPNSPSHGAVDWAGGRGPGLTPQEIWNKAREKGAEIIQVNHPRHPSGGAAFQQYFNRVGFTVDPDNDFIGSDPDRMPFTPQELRMPEGAEMLSFDFDTFEIYNGFHVKDANKDGILEDENVDLNLRAWFDMLSFGIIKTAVAVTDTHSPFLDFPGFPRTYVGVDNDDPQTIEESDFISGLKDRRDAIMTNTPFIRVTDPDGNNLIGKTITVDPSSVVMHVDIQSPAWAGVDTLEVFINKIYKIPEEQEDKFMNPQIVISLDDTMGGLENDKLWHYVIDVDLSEYVQQDSWVVFRVSGMNYSIFPVVFEDISADPEDIISGNADNEGIFPMAITNAILLDTDGNGRFDPPY